MTFTNQCFGSDWLRPLAAVKGGCQGQRKPCVNRVELHGRCYIGDNLERTTVLQKQICISFPTLTVSINATEVLRESIKQLPTTSIRKLKYLVMTFREIVMFTCL